MKRWKKLLLIRRIKAWCAADNIGSRRIMEKAGMIQTSIEKKALEINGKKYNKINYILIPERSEDTMLYVRKAVEHDFDRIMAIYRNAQDYMIQSGNPDQWGHFYPEPGLVKSDIRDGLCHVICDKTEIHGVFALLAGDEPTYQYIEDGEWLNDAPYVTIHRIAGDGQVHGVFQCASEYCKSICSNVRIDTHENNKTMQRQIEKNGFEKCGTIYVEDGSPRLAYHWAKKEG